MALESWTRRHKLSVQQCCTSRLLCRLCIALQSASSLPWLQDSLNALGLAEPTAVQHDCSPLSGAEPLAGIDVHAADRQVLCGSCIRRNNSQVMALDIEGQVVQRNGTDQAQSVRLARVHSQVEMAAAWPNRPRLFVISTIACLCMHCD